MKNSITRPTLNRRDLLKATAATALTPLVSTLMPGILNAKAPMLGVSTPNHYRFKLGNFEVTTIVDSEVFIDGPYPIIGKNASEEEVAKLMKDNLVPVNKFQPGFTPTIVNTGKELVLFDTGNGEDGFVKRPNGGWLAERLKPAGINPEDIDIVIITHGHPDHIGGLLEKGKPLCPNARYVIGATEHDYWYKSSDLKGFLKTSADLYRKSVDPVIEKFSFIKPGEEITSGITAVKSFGHTPGHLSYHIDGGSEKVLFWGDCAHHHVASLASPDWHCVFDIDQPLAAATRKTIFDMAATDKLPVIGFHMPFPSIGYVENKGASGYQWVPHSFQLTNEG